MKKSVEKGMEVIYKRVSGSDELVSRLSRQMSKSGAAKNRSQRSQVLLVILSIRCHPEFTRSQSKNKIRSTLAHVARDVIQKPGSLTQGLDIWESWTDIID
jgi:hypothetical protein